MSGPTGGGIERGFVARAYSDLQPGEEFWGSLTVTESHVVTAAGIFNDPGPNHVNQLQATAGRFGTRIAHGPLLVGIAFGVLGNSLGATIVALLEQSSRFHLPVRLGDTVIPRWVVTETTPKPSLGGGIVDFEGEIFNQSSESLIDLSATLAVAEQPPWRPWEQATEQGHDGDGATKSTETDRSDD